MKTFVFLLMCMLTVQCTDASDRVFLNETTPGLSFVYGDKRGQGANSGLQAGVSP